ncbi:MAG TPA: hypothetical protein VNJ08_10340 [Bacteriovoracaceae bacterium]|nr:hypothetical protein [Bacteriovoracaceae bacterium]
MKKNKPSKAATKKKITSEELDKKFDRGESILEYADLDLGVFRVNVDFPVWTVSALDKEATRLGISRQALIKVWITERIDQSDNFKHTGT